MENSLFTITNDDLGRLDASGSVALISELLWADATRLGIPTGKVQISAEVNMPDDGVDAKIDVNCEKRAWYLASFVPKQLFHSNERSCLAREVLIRHGKDASVRRNLMANFSTESWSGSASGHYQAKKQWLLDFKEEETDTNVKLWIDEYVEDLQRQIDYAKVSEEREF